MRVLVAMSGGVDSAAAALLLREQGHDVEGVTLRLFDRNIAPDEQVRQGIEDARSMAAKLDMAHTVLDLRETFSRRVVDRFVSEYAAGRTPNPCLDCNRGIKFGALLAYAQAQGFHALATGHYAIVERDGSSGRFGLRRPVDAARDQSYVLYSLRQEQLSRVLFPLGRLTKPEARVMAERAGLVSAHKRDSQDICFIPEGDYTALVDRMVPPTPGDIRDAKGALLGRHNGLTHYTIGQRRGLGVPAAHRLYVIGKDRRTNTLLVGEESGLYRGTLFCAAPNFISIELPEAPLRVMVQTRYHQTPLSAVIRMEGENVRVDFDRAVRAAAPGQAAVFYDGDAVVGGGTILDDQ